MLKIAFERGLRAAVADLPITTPDASIVKEAIFKKMWGGLKKMVGKGSKAVGEAAPKVEKLVPPAKPGANATAEQAAQYAKANTEYSAKQLSRSGFNPAAKMDEAAEFARKAPAESKEWLSNVEQAGTKGMLGGGFGPAGFAMPTAAGAGIGYAVDGQEGALAGAGLGAGARLGGSSFLQKLREAKGFAGALGKKAPAFSEMLGTEAGKRGLIGAGALGLGLGGAGYAAGQAIRPPEEEPWYGGAGLGLTPQQTQELGQMAMPMLSEQLGLDPSMVQALAAQYGFAPAQQPQGVPEQPMTAEQPAEYYPDEAIQYAPSDYEGY